MSRFCMTSVILLLFFNLSFLSRTNTMCERLKNVEGEENNSLLKLRRVRALCDVIQSSRRIFEKEDSDFIPDFDLTQIDSENEANQILKRFRRGRSSSSGGSRSSSSSGSRWSSSSSGGSSRFFSRSSSSSSSGSGSRLFSRGDGGTSSGGSHRVREAFRSMVRKSTSSGSGGLSGTDGSKPSFSDKIRKITHSIGGGGNRFGGGGSGSTGGNAWVRAGKTFLPHAVRFGKRYYQRRKYNKGVYAGAGYYAGSRMNHHGSSHPYDNYGYPPVVDNPPDQINGKTLTVFYCIQEDLNTTLVNKTLNAEGFGLCNISGQLIACPIEIECKTSEADNCCEDDYGTPYCCGGPIPDEYSSQYGGYEDNWNDATESIHQILNVVTTIWIILGTICWTIWQGRE